MTCIVINDKPAAGEVIGMLIHQTADLVWVASFSDTFEASIFMAKNDVDIVFLDIQTDKTKGYQFVKAIPPKTFVIFISGFPSAAIPAYKPGIVMSSKSVRFQQGISKARIYYQAVRRGDLNIADDYFVI